MVYTAIKSGYPCPNGSFVFEFPTESEARGVFACDASLVLRVLEKWGANKAIVRVPGQEDIAVPIDTIRLMQEFEPIVEIFFADVSLPPIVLRAATEKSEEGGRWGIVRLRDERQVVMSSGMSGVLLAGVGIDETTQWRRPEFWNLEHLRDFNRDWQRQLDVENESSLEYRYQIRKPGTTEPWEWYRSSYRLLQDRGDLYQICTFIERG